MATLKRYLSLSPLTLFVSIRGAQIPIAFSGKDVSKEHKQYFFETKNPEVQEAIEASPMINRSFRLKSAQEVDDKQKAATQDPRLPLLKEVEAQDEETEPEAPDDEVEETEDAEEPKEDAPGPNKEIPEEEREVKTAPEPEAPAKEEEKEQPATGLTLVEVKDLAAAKRWLTDKGVKCTPKTTKVIAESEAMTLGYNLVFNKDLKS